MFFSGYIADVPDDRDFDFASSSLMGARVRASDGSIDHAHHLDAVQLQLGNSCVGHSIASAAYLGAAVDGIRIPRPSPLFPYTIARLLAGGPVRDDGCMPRHALAGVVAYGLVLNDRWPERAADINATPPLDAFLMGDEGRVGSYFRIARGDDGSSFVDALRRGFCPVFGMDIDESYVQYRRGLWTPSGKAYGGHMQCIVGYHERSDAFHVLNSWGASWGDDGFAWIPRESLCSRYVDAYVLTVLPGGLR